MKTGRPNLPDVVRTCVSIDKTTLKKLKELGDGNVSLGIRKLVKELVNEGNKERWENWRLGFWKN